MRVLAVQEVMAAPARLDASWEDPTSFVVPPDRFRTSENWLARTLERVPPALAQGHFALLTSGSTGQPRLVIGNRRRAERLVRVLHEVQGSDCVRETILTLPLFYAYAFINQWLWARQWHRTLVVTPGFSDPAAVDAAFSRAEAAMVCLVGSQLKLLWGVIGTKAYPGVVRVHFAGAPFPQDKLGQIRQTFPNAVVFNNYGCTEAMPRLAVRRAEAAETWSDIGDPLPGIELRTDDAERLLFRSPYGAIGVVEEGAFQAIGEQDWVPTGDIAERNPAGRWMLLGRANQVFKRHGEKISLVRVLSRIKTGWSGEVTFYTEVDAAGEAGHVLLLTPSPSEEELRRLLRVFRTEFPRSHWPLRVESTESLPLMGNGKIDVEACRASTAVSVHWRQRV